jgi:hypothetical protein
VDTPILPVVIGAVLSVILLLAGVVVYRIRGVAWSAARCADRADQLARAAHVRLDVRAGLDPSPSHGRHRQPAERSDRARRSVRVRPVGGSAAAAVVAAGLVVLLLGYGSSPDATPSPWPVAPPVAPPVSVPSSSVRVAPAAAERTSATVSSSPTGQPPTETSTAAVVPPPPTETATVTVVPPPPSLTTPGKPTRRVPKPREPKPRERCQLKVLVVCLDLDLSSIIDR